MQDSEKDLKEIASKDQRKPVLKFVHVCVCVCICVRAHASGRAVTNM